MLFIAIKRLVIKIISVGSKSRNFNWSEFLAPAGAKTGYCRWSFVPLSSHRLMMLYICTKFQKIYQRVSEFVRDTICILKFKKGHNSV